MLAIFYNFVACFQLKFICLCFCGTVTEFWALWKSFSYYFWVQLHDYSGGRFTSI